MEIQQNHAEGLAVLHVLVEILTTVKIKPKTNCDAKLEETQIFPYIHTRLGYYFALMKMNKYGEKN